MTLPGDGAGAMLTVALPWAPSGSTSPGVFTPTVTFACPLADDAIEVAIVTGGYDEPGDSASPPLPDLVQVTICPDVPHVQPLPVADVTVWPAGTLNVSVTVPVVGPDDGALDTVSW